jgi:hypothetical protein
MVKIRLFTRPGKENCGHSLKNPLTFIIPAEPSPCLYAQPAESGAKPVSKPQYPLNCLSEPSEESRSSHGLRSFASLRMTGKTVLQ